jgi:hypothetical protein
MEPITLALLLTLVATKATEKVGEQIGDGAIASGKHLWEVLQRRSPKTAQRLALAGALSDGDVIDAEIIEEVKQVVADEPEVQAAAAAAAAAVTAEPASLQALTKLADKIGVVNFGNIENQNNTINI